ncbi:tetratricopeptide repeat protein [bacterium]|nr:tetratricopeptide repeat protein [bacterium]
MQGYFHLHQGEVKEALYDFQEALKLCPTHQGAIEKIQKIKTP